MRREHQGVRCLNMGDGDALDALQQASFAFVGTIEQLGAATMADLDVDDRTAVVRVDRVLHAPEGFTGLAGERITLKLAPDADVPGVGETLGFFANGLAFGDSIALGEVGRRPAAELEQLTAAATGDQVELARLRRHVDEADAVVVATVVRLQDVEAPDRSEHDPDWWQAVLAVDRVARGTVAPGELTVLFPNSLDVLWRHAPKPKPGQDGVWILHGTGGELRALAPFQLLHAEDYQPVQSLDRLRMRTG